MNSIFSSNYATASRRDAATVVWIKETTESGTVAQQFTSQMTASLTTVENETARAVPQKVDARQRWQIDATNFQDRYWECLFKAAIAKPGIPGATGKEAARQIQDRSPGPAVRLLQIGSGEYLASYVTEGDFWYLFDPKSGLWKVQDSDIPGFTAHMKRYYQLNGNERTALSSWVVAFPINLHTTWIGQPQANDRELMCVKALGNAKLSADVAARVKFWCLEQFRVANQVKLRDRPNVELGVINDLLPDRLDGTNLLTQPDFSNLGKCVETILWEFTKALRPNSSPDDKKKLAFAKDLWSLYCLYTFGGYHFDAGMELVDQNKPVILPCPTTLGAMEVSTGQPIDFIHRKAENYAGSAGIGLTCMSLSPTFKVIAGMMSEQPMPILKQEAGNCPKIPPVDVPILRSPKNGSGIKKALQTYIYLWFALRDRSKLEKIPPGVIDLFIRETVVSSVATGITHWEPPCPVREVRKGCTFAQGELNLNKKSFQTHY